MKIALCYFGLIRGFKFDNTFESHKKNIYDQFEEQNINFSVFVSTYDKDYDHTNVEKIPNLKKLIKLNDEEITNKIKQISEKFIVPTNYTEELKLNLLKCWYSQQQFYDIIKNSNETYDYIIVMDIAQLVLNPIDNLNLLDNKYFYFPNFAFHKGYCGRMIIGNQKNILFFLNKYKYITTEIDYKLNIHPESFYKNYIKEIGKLQVKFLKIKFWRCRTNGYLVKDVK